MLAYFEKTSPKDWTMNEALKEVQAAYPEKQRAYHLHLIKEELKFMSNHKNQSHRLKAQEMIQNWKHLVKTNHLRCHKLSLIKPTIKQIIKLLTKRSTR